MVITVSRSPLKNIWQTVARNVRHRAQGVILLLVILASACSAPRNPAKLVLLAPFEGQYREIGYNALYAVRLALDEIDSATELELVALDDGGSDDLAVQRATAIASDPDVAGVLLLGPFASSSDVQQALGNAPRIIIGLWGDDVPLDGTIVLTHPEIAEALLSEQGSNPFATGDTTQESITAGDILGLESVRSLLPATTSALMLTSGNVPDAEFDARYRASGQFVPAPNHLAELTYLAARVLGNAAGRNIDRDSINAALIDAFPTEQGYWINAPLNAYRIENRLLRAEALDDVIE